MISPSLKLRRMKEGYIKFNLNWNQKPFDFSDDDYMALNSYRKKLFDLGFIGQYPDGIGFGNISIRYQQNQFIISGSATGGLKDLKKEHYALVTGFDIQNNHVTCKGLTKASSESLSHAIIYDANPKVNAVIHVHHKDMWNCYLMDLPTTNRKAEFGTPEMALEIKKYAHQSSGIIIMGGHPEGIITYGKSLVEANTILVNYYNKI